MQPAIPQGSLAAATTSKHSPLALNKNECSMLAYKEEVSSTFTAEQKCQAWLWQQQQQQQQSFAALAFWQQQQ